MGVNTEVHTCFTSLINWTMKQIISSVNLQLRLGRSGKQRPNTLDSKIQREPILSAPWNSPQNLTETQVLHLEKSDTMQQCRLRVDQIQGNFAESDLMSQQTNRTCSYQCSSTTDKPNWILSFTNTSTANMSRKWLLLLLWLELHLQQCHFGHLSKKEALTYWSKSSRGSLQQPEDIACNAGVFVQLGVKMLAGVSYC